MNILILLKILFSLSLFGTFFFFFGLPSWRKYQAKEVFINKQKISIHNIPPPAITFCAFQEGSAWKPDHSEDTLEYGNSSSEDFLEYDNSSSGGILKYENSSYEDILKYDYSSSGDILEYQNHAEADSVLQSEILSQCEDSNSAEEVFACVDAKTFNFNETIPTALSEITLLNYSDISNPAFWISEITLSNLGRCHTLNNSVSLGSAKWSFYFDPSTAYTVYIHDPHYFMMTANPATIPMINLDMDLTQGLLFMYMEVVQHVNMDRTNQPCEAAKDYSFTACLRNSVASKVGCR